MLFFVVPRAQVPTPFPRQTAGEAYLLDNSHPDATTSLDFIHDGMRVKVAACIGSEGVIITTGNKIETNHINYSRLVAR